MNEIHSDEYRPSPSLGSVLDLTNNKQNRVGVALIWDKEKVFIQYDWLNSSQESITFLGDLLGGIITGKCRQQIYDTLQIKAKQYPEKAVFIQKVITQLQEYERMVSKPIATPSQIAPSLN